MSSWSQDRPISLDEAANVVRLTWVLSPRVNFFELKLLALLQSISTLG